jgi:hypothetical protein
MDKQLRELLRTVLEADPDATLDDDGRRAVMYAMLGLHTREHIVALWEFAQSIEDAFKRSYLLHNLADRAAQYLNFDLSEKIARSITEPYWRLSAMNRVASELLRRDRESANINVGNKSGFRDLALRLLSEVEKELPGVPEDDGDRATVLWGAGLSLVDAGKLEWAENLAATDTYCSENTEVLLRSAKARAARDESVQAAQLALTVGKLASTGSGQETNRAYDLRDVAALLYGWGAKDDACKYLKEAARFAFASQQGHDIEGCKTLAAIAIEFAKEGQFELARDTANLVTQPARQKYALDEIENLAKAKS